MPSRSDSIDSTYNLRKNPLNIRSSDGSDLILSKVDRLAEMANSSTATQPLVSFSNSSSSTLHHSPLQYQLPPPTKDFGISFSSSASKSLSSLHSSDSAMTELQSPATIYTTQSNNSSNIVFLSDKDVKSIPPAFNSTVENAETSSKSTKKVFHDVISDDEDNGENDTNDTEDIDTNDTSNTENSESSDRILPSALKPPTLSWNDTKSSSPSSSSSFLPLELSLANDDFSSLVNHDFSNSSFSYSYAIPPPSSPQNNPPPSGLTRKNTISSTSGKVYTANSTMPSLVFERMKSFRKPEQKQAIDSSPLPPVAHLSEPVARSISGVSSTSIVSKPLFEIPAPASASIHSSTPQSLERGNSQSSNFTILSFSTVSEQHSSLSRGPSASRIAPPPIDTSIPSHFKPYYTTTNSSTDSQNKPAFKHSTSSSPTRNFSTSSTSSFDYHIAEQLSSIPSPLLNAISFTPPMTAVDVATDNDDVDSISIYSTDSQKSKNPRRNRSQKNYTADPIPEENEDPALDEEIEEVSTEPENPIDPEDRGRFFVRIEGLQGLRLPFIQSRNPQFTMTLDNGVQSVTIDPLPITATNPGVGQEFELVVGEDLQFILTFQAAQDPLSSMLPEKSDEVIQRELDQKQKEKEAEERRLAQEEQDRKQREWELMNANIEKKGNHTTPQSSPKKSRFRGLFSSPKKKHMVATSAATQQGLSENNKKVTTTTIAIEDTIEMRTKAQGKKVTTPTSPTKPAARKKEVKRKDIWDGLTGPRGEFGRCYLVESQYEKEVFGRPRTFNLAVYNEWSYNEVPILPKSENAEGEGDASHGLSLADMMEVTTYGADNSTKMKKKGNGALLTTNEAAALTTRYRTQYKNEEPPKYKRVPVEPYKIATIQVTMMYIPRATMEGKMPSSMKAAVKELGLSKVYKNIALDGFLSQEGGDCNYWRRRWFTLRAAELIGHTEDTKKVRTVLNLANVKSVLDTEHMTHQEKREMMASCMYHDRAFRMTFNDNEVITFYADSIDSKNAWMDALNIAIQHCTGKSFEWSDVVIAYHDYEKEQLAETHKKKLQHEQDRAKEHADMNGKTKLITASELMKNMK